MRKLILVEFDFQTGDNRYDNAYRLVVVDQNEGYTETDLLNRSIDIFVSKFKESFPESALIRAVPHATIGA